MQKYSIRHDKNEKHHLSLGDGKFALGIAVGSAGVLLLYLTANISFESIGENQYFKTIPILVSLLVAMISSYFAANALLEQRKTREAGTDPVLIAHLGQREDARELITFNVSNVGSGAALNVQLEIEKPNDPVVNRDLLHNIFRTHHPYAVILQGKSIEFNLGLGWELLGESPLPPFQVKMTYTDLVGNEYESEFSVDVQEMLAFGSHKSPQMRIVTALEKMAKS